MKLEVCCDDEFYDEYPLYARITFTKEQTKRIIELHKALTSVKAAKICDYDSPDEWLADDQDVPWDGRVDCGMVMVWDSHVRWHDYIKNTCIGIETQEVPMWEILEINRVLTIPPKELPLMISNLKSEEAKRILEQRLKERIDG